MIFQKKKVVCFGGGTGLPSLLSGLKQIPWLEVTAVVNMFDSGGSSGQLKDKFGILPPGDVLKCLLALSKHEYEAREILLKRIRNLDQAGHTGGNVLLLGLEKLYGDHLSAVDALGQLLSIKGKVVPVSSSHGSICAEYEDGSIYKSETSVDVGIQEGKIVKRLFLEPEVDASNVAIEAIKSADYICAGPGSFYTSVMPNFLPKGIREAIKNSKSPIIFISNLLTEGMGMREFKAERFLSIIEDHMGREVSAILVNDNFPEQETLDRYATEKKYPIINGNDEDERFILANLWTDTKIARHDSATLANLVFAIINKIESNKEL
jgi:uncharacterized cofD-like protein